MTSIVQQALLLIACIAAVGAEPAPVPVVAGAQVGTAPHQFHERQTSREEVVERRSLARHAKRQGGPSAVPVVLCGEYPAFTDFYLYGSRPRSGATFYSTIVEDVNEDWAGQSIIGVTDNTADARPVRFDASCRLTFGSRLYRHSWNRGSDPVELTAILLVSDAFVAEQDDRDGYRPMTCGIVNGMLECADDYVPANGQFCTFGSTDHYIYHGSPTRIVAEECDVIEVYAARGPLAPLD